LQDYYAMHLMTGFKEVLVHSSQPGAIHGIKTPKVSRPTTWAHLFIIFKNSKAWGNPPNQEVRFFQLTSRLSERKIFTIINTFLKKHLEMKVRKVWAKKKNSSEIRKRSDRSNSSHAFL